MDSMKVFVNVGPGLAKEIPKGIFPNKMKIAKVIPKYKAGDIHELTNYRPVSLLPQSSKILEKVFYNRLDGFITKHMYYVNSNAPLGLIG